MWRPASCAVEDLKQLTARMTTRLPVAHSPHRSDASAEMQAAERRQLNNDTMTCFEPIMLRFDGHAARWSSVIGGLLRVNCGM